MATFKSNSKGMRDLERQINANLEKASKKHPIQEGDSEADIRRKLTEIAEDAGAAPDDAGIRAKAREIHRDMNK